MLAVIGIKSRSFIVIYCFVLESKGYAEEFPLHRDVNKGIVAFRWHCDATWSKNQFLLEAKV